MGADGESVTVIGLGLMGSALARAFGVAGCELTVWNRTPQKAEPLAGIATVAGTVEEACAASRAIVVSLLDYRVSDAVLRRTEVEKSLSGKLLIQLTTWTPADARDGETWARRHDVAYLDGAIMTYPRGIGDENATVFYSGPRAAFDESVQLLSALGGKPTFCGEAIGAAATLDLALLDLLFGASAALLHGAAICAAESLPLEDFFRLVPGWLEAIGAVVPEGVGSGSYPHGNSTMITNAAGIQHIVRASQQAGIDVSFPKALLSWFVKSIERGYGADDLPSLYESFRRA